MLRALEGLHGEMVNMDFYLIINLFFGLWIIVMVYTFWETHKWIVSIERSLDEMSKACDRMLKVLDSLGEKK